MHKLLDFYEKLDKSIYTDWVCRILITLVLIVSELIAPHGYCPTIQNAFAVIALWFYFFKMRVIALGFLSLAIYNHIQHEFVHNIYC